MGSAAPITRGSSPIRSARSRSNSGTSAAMNACIVRCTARPPSKSTPPRPELSRARTRQDELRRRRFLQDGVNDREQFGDPLDLVDHHRRLPGRACQQFPKALGTGAQAAMQRRFEQVQIQGIGEPVTQPCGFAGSARTEQEAALVRNLGEIDLRIPLWVAKWKWEFRFAP